jgi:hypothetical protein
MRNHGTDLLGFMLMLGVCIAFLNWGGGLFSAPEPPRLDPFELVQYQFEHPQKGPFTMEFARYDFQDGERITITTAFAIMKKYRENKLALDADARARTYIVVGTAYEINSDMMGEPFIALTGTGIGGGDVQCFFPDPAQLLSVKAGDKLAIVGRCSGFFHNMVLHNCRFAREVR